MLVSIIIPVHKTTAFLKECVDSALGQTYQNIEVILACNGDLKLQDCQAFLNNPDERLVYMRALKGRHHARNEALQISKGEFIQFLDYDDILFPAKIEKQIAGLGEKINSSLVISKWKKFKVSLNESYKFPFPGLFEEPLITSETLVAKLGYSGGFIATASWLISRDIALKGHWIDSPNDDAVYLSYILKEKPGIIMIPEILAGYRIHENNTSSIRTNTDLDNLLKSWKIIEKNLSLLDVWQLNIYLYKAYVYLISYSKQIDNYRLPQVIYKTFNYGIRGRLGWRVFRDLKNNLLSF